MAILVMIMVMVMTVMMMTMMMVMFMLKTKPASEEFSNAPHDSPTNRDTRRLKSVRNHDDGLGNDDDDDGLDNNDMMI